MMTCKQIEAEIVEIQDLGWFHWAKIHIARLVELREMNRPLFSYLFRHWAKTPYDDLLGFKKPASPKAAHRYRDQAFKERVKRFVLSHPKTDYRTVGAKFGVSDSQIGHLMRDMGIRRGRGCFTNRPRRRKRK